MDFIITVLQVLLCVKLASFTHAHDISKRSVFSWKKPVETKDIEVPLPGYRPALKVHKYNGILINPVQGPPLYLSNSVPGSSSTQVDQFLTANLSPEDAQQLDWLNRIATFLPDEGRLHEFDYTALLPYVNLIPDDSLEKLQHVVESAKTKQKSKLLTFIAFLKSAKEKKLKPFKYAAKVGADLLHKKKEKVQSLLHLGYPSSTTEIPPPVVIETTTSPAFPFPLPGTFNPFLVTPYPPFPSYPYPNSPSFSVNSQTPNAYTSRANAVTSQSTSFSANLPAPNAYAAQPNTVTADATSFSVNLPAPSAYVLQSNTATNLPGAGAYAPQLNTATSDFTSYSANPSVSYVPQANTPTSDSASPSQSVTAQGNSFYYSPQYSQYASPPQASSHTSNQNPAYSNPSTQTSLSTDTSQQSQSQFFQNQYPNTVAYMSYRNPSFSQQVDHAGLQSPNELQVSHQTNHFDQETKQNDVAAPKWEQTFATHQHPQEAAKYVVHRYGHREHPGKPLTPADTYLSTDLTGSASENHEQINERNVNVIPPPKEMESAGKKEETNETTHRDEQHHQAVSSTPKVRITKVYAVQKPAYVFPETSTEAKAKDTETSHNLVPQPNSQ